MAMMRKDNFVEKKKRDDDDDERERNGLWKRLIMPKKEKEKSPV